MKRITLYSDLARRAETRLLLYVVDGLGGLPAEPGGATELETAATPTFDRLADRGSTGLITPVHPGIAPGSGPAHLALFGYDPVETMVGRGVLAALGIGFDLRPGDVAARINLCTLDAEGRVVDRRAGRIESDEAIPLIERLDRIELESPAECHVRHVKEYRACVVFRGDGLDGRVADTDPQATGVPPRAPEPLDAAAAATAELARQFIARAGEELAGEGRASGVLLRGFDSYEPLPDFERLYGLRAAGVAAYPMYRGVARAVGMEVFPVGDVADEILDATRRAVVDHDFVFVHFKSTDSRGEDGDFAAKVEAIEAADGLLARILDGVEPGFDVVVVTGDHSTPAVLGCHSGHPVPALLHGGPCRRNPASGFGETACAQGSLGFMSSRDILPLALAQAGRLGKYGA